MPSEPNELPSREEMHLRMQELIQAIRRSMEPSHQPSPEMLPRAGDETPDPHQIADPGE